MTFNVSRLALQSTALSNAIKQQKQHRKQNVRYCCWKEHVFSIPVPFGGGGGGGIQH